MAHLGSVRGLVKTNPSAYLRGLAKTLNILGILYEETQRFTDAQTVDEEALQILRNLAKTNPPPTSQESRRHSMTWESFTVARSG